MKSTLLYTILAVCIFASCGSNKQTITENNSSAYPDTAEQRIDSAIFAPYRQGDTWFFVDRRTTGPYAGYAKAEQLGEWERTAPFNRYNLATVVKNGLGGFIDTSGKIIIPLSYKMLSREFKDGLAVMHDMHDHSGVINVQGDTIVPFSHCNISTIAHGMIVTKTLSKKAMLYDYKGNIIIDSSYYTDISISYDDAESNYLPFYCKEMPGKPYREEGYNGYMTKEGKLIGHIEYHTAGDFVNGRGKVWINRLRGFVDSTGNLVIPCIYKQAKNFVNGTAVVQDTNKLWGTIDKMGDQVIPIEYEALGTKGCKEGFIPAKKNGKWGLLSCTGEVILDFTYDDCEHVDYHFGLISMKKGDKWGLIDSNGNVIIPFEYYTYIGIMTPNRFYILDENDNYGIIDRGNNIIAPAKYFRLGPSAFNVIVDGFISIQEWDSVARKRIPGYIDVYGKEYFED